MTAEEVRRFDGRERARRESEREGERSKEEATRFFFRRDRFFVLSKKVETFTFLLRLRQSIPFAKAKNECSRPPRRRPGPRPAPGVDFGMLASIGRDWRVSERAAETHIAEVFFMRERFFFFTKRQSQQCSPSRPSLFPPPPRYSKQAFASPAPIQTHVDEVSPKFQQQKALKVRFVGAISRGLHSRRFPSTRAKSATQSSRPLVA